MTHFDEWVAQHFTELWPEACAPEVVDPMVDFLAERAGAGPVLELAIGTGRIALPLARRGVRVRGIELSPAMVAELRTQEGGADIEVIVGDFATAQVEGSSTLAYLVANTITNLITQDEQVACFRNAAAHLASGGCFVIENYIPQLQRIPRGETKHVFVSTPTHVGVDEYDVAAQLSVSHHWWVLDGEFRTFSSTHRYLWPAELDLMARMAGLELRERYGGWRREPFNSESGSHVSVWEKP